MFSICIPNYNYEKYLGLTLESIFNQTYTDFEVTIADNCSTDNSMGIVRNYTEKYPGRIRYKVNPVNLGFAANLDQAGSLASSPFMIMLSSDDIIQPEALATYKATYDWVDDPERTILCAANDVINSQGMVIRSPRAKDFRFKIWRDEDLDEGLSERLGVPVYRVAANTLLHRSLIWCSNPFNFLSTCYSKRLYQDVGGYGSSRLINPDKWFHWRILAVAKEAVFIDTPLFQYRWHNQNQTAQQLNSGYLKFLVDEYRNTIDISDDMLARAQVSRNQFNASFIRSDVLRHGIGEFTRGRWLKALRIFFFGLSTYPVLMFRSLLFLPFLLLLLTTPLGAKVISWFRR